MLAQVQTNAPMHFNKPYILVTRVGNNDTNDTYRNPHQKYYEHNNMKELFKHAARIGGNETPISALRITDEGVDTYYEVDNTPYRSLTRADYFHNFPAALDEYKRGIRVDM